MRTRKPKAVVLVISLAILLLISALGATFVRLSSQERHAGRNYLHKAQARFLAHAGIGRAIGEIKDRFLAKGYLDGSESFVYVPGSTSESLEDTFYPSLWYDKDGDGVRENGKDGTPDDDLVHGRMVSGVIETPKGYGGDNWNERYDKLGQTYTLRIIDTAGMLHINSKQKNLATLLENLGLALAKIHFVNPLPAGTGAAIVTYRDLLPGARYSDKEQLLDVLAKDKYELVRDYLTTEAWTDPDTVRPKPLGERRGRGGTPLKLGDVLYAMDELNPVTLETEPRAPVNVNTAAWAVLAAVFLGVKGFYLDEDVDKSSLGDASRIYKWIATKLSYGGGDSGRLGRLKESIAIDLAKADTLAKEIIARRKTTPFANWTDFAAWLRARTYLDAYQQAALLANANPNTNLNDWNPPEALWQPIDKTDLAAYTTELAFSATGQFWIESLGRVTMLDGQIVASHRTRVLVESFEQLRETTQKQFLSDYLATSSIDTVFSAVSAPTVTSGGRALQSYPELRKFAAKAHYDGHLALATLETSSVPPAMLYAPLSTDFQARNPGSVATPVLDKDGPYINPLVPGDAAVHPGDLRVDGIYAERDSSLAWPVPGNWNIRHGAVTFWFKPNWNPAKTPRPHGLYSTARLWHSGVGMGTKPVNPSPWGIWYFPVTKSASLDSTGPFPYFPALASGRKLSFGWGFENAGGKPERMIAGIVSPTLSHDGHSHSPAKDSPLKAHRWIHVGVSWAWEGGGKLVQMWINGAEVAQTNVFHSPIYDPPITSSTNFKNHFDGSDNLLRFGERASIQANNNPADGTLDEIRTYPVSSATVAPTDYKRGRFYKGAGTFYSRATHFTAKRVVGQVRWTHYIPAALTAGSVTVRVYDTMGTDDRTDDVLLGSSSSAEGKLAIGKLAKGVRYEIDLASGVSGITPATESPIFDDITIVHSPATLRTLAWLEE